MQTRDSLGQKEIDKDRARQKETEKDTNICREGQRETNREKRKRQCPRSINL